MSFSYIRLLQMSNEIKDKDTIRQIAEYRDHIYREGARRAREFKVKGPLDTLNPEHARVLNLVGEEYLQTENSAVATLLLSGDSINPNRKKGLEEGNFSFAHDDSAEGIFNGKLGRLSMTSTWELSNVFRYSSVCEVIAGLKKKSIRMLDLGCSSGTFLNFWYKNFQKPGKVALDYTGIEALEDSVAHARQVYPNKKFIQADICKTDLRDICSSQDVILHLEILEHIGQDAVDRVLEASHDLLSADGIMIISSPNPKKNLGQEFVWIDNHVYEFSLAEMKAKLAEHSFEIVDVFGWFCDSPQMKRYCRQQGHEELLDRLKKISTSFGYAVVSHLYPEIASHYTIICKKTAA